MGVNADRREDNRMRRAEKVRSMRLAGLSWRQISEKVHVSVETVKKDWDRIQVEFPEQTARQLVAEQDAQLVEMLKPFFLKAITGNDRAANTALRIMDHRARLFSLFDLPQDNGQQDAQDALAELIKSIQDAATKE
ncbi:hypothetical protein H0194_04615 [Corynebacterium incognita]|uniref:Uncharacterized protein n=1 Tax=Corynebacterium incognita TaxID=2754725 RepID=A0A7G7CRQ0_9CORY|nr:hypothetical protein [Corynebacterium incognita]QNE90266.1 hypothetical protein H0194_04615 [Corynebacterium incognita]